MSSPTKTKYSFHTSVASPEKSTANIPVINTADAALKPPEIGTSKLKSKIVEFTCGLLDLPALKRKYLGKHKRDKQRKEIDGLRRKSFVANDDDKFVKSAQVQHKSKIGIY